MAEGRNVDSDARHALSPAHAGALAARMLILEEDCREIDHNLDGSHGIFREYAGQIPEATKEQIRAMLVEILDKVASIKLDLGLPKQTVELEKLIESRLSHIWVTLYESRSQSLRGYGAVPEKLKEYLDPRVEEILGLLAGLREALQKAKLDGKPGRASNEML
jgi:hypothetical protein